MKTRIVEAERFTAVADDGTRYTVVRLQTIMQTATLSGRPSSHKGGFDFALANGGKVIPLDQDRFEIAKTGQVIRRV